MSITQSKRDSTLSVSLPTLNISYSTFFPFKRKEAVGKERWYEKISMRYTGTLANSINNVKEDMFFKSSLQRDWKNGMKHNIPVSATFNLLKYINVSPSFDYTERWYLTSTEKSWDEKVQKEKIDTLTKFNRVYDFSMGVTASTKLYGTYTPLRALFGDKIDRIRHVMTPSIGFSYRPDFGDEKWGYYGTYTKKERDATNPEIYHESEVKYSRYERNLYGAPTAGKSGSINFSLTNNVEMKVRNDNDTTGKEAFKKISLIDNFSISALSREGLLFTNFYANSFRTDRGLVSVLSGFPAQPSTSIMKYPRKLQHMPSFPSSMKQVGYDLQYFYGGDADFTSMRSYLKVCGFDAIVEDVSFPAQFRTSKWGVPDHLVFSKLLSEIKNEQQAPFLKVMQTLSSHNPTACSLRHKQTTK
jgi:hypothetical protein